MDDKFRDNDRIVFLLYSSEDGKLLAIIGGYRLSQFRTGATSALAVKLLSRSEPSVIGILGSGVHARAELQGLQLVRDIKKIKVYSPNRQHREKFAQDMTEKLSITINPVNTISEAIEGSDIISTVTTSLTALFEAKGLKSGVHINAVGANSPDRQEISNSVLQKADLIVTDYKEQAMIESGNLINGVKSGKITWDQIIELGDIVSRKVPARQDDYQSTLYISNGFVIEDVAVAVKTYQLAIERGLGREISLRGHVPMEGGDSVI
jgi:ornithine cyclodeaminase/alanine dehydrogenase-like protein (mu-crystallin family)